ncbi:MAG: hypothetical protein QXK74_03605 [Candidatus Nitrosocaldaceae archaeon]
MKKGIVLIVLIFMISIAYAYADNEFIIWIPEKMLIGEEYEGIVIARNATDHSRDVMLISDEKLSISDHVTIKPYQNHAKFKIKPLIIGNSTVFGVLDENFATKSTNIYKNIQTTNSLKIILQKKIVDSAFGYIFLLDNNGIPVEAKKDMKIRLIAEGGVSVIDSITIKKGNYYASFIARVESDGKIYAISEDARSTSIDIKRDTGRIDIRLAVAPHIILPDSKAYFYVWLEKDGRPYIPKDPLNVILTSSNIAVASFNPLFKGVNEEKHSIVIDERFESGEIYTHNIGNATITAFINGVGATTTNLIVGALFNSTLTITQTDSIGKTFSTQNVTITDVPNDATATDVILWVYPNVIESDSRAEGLVALYQIKKNYTQEVRIGKNNTVSIHTSAAESIIPVENDGNNFRIIDLSSDGLEHPSILTPSVLFKEHAIRFDIYAIRDGKFTLVAGGSNIFPSSIEVNVIPQAQNSLDASILPIKKGVKQPLIILPGIGYQITSNNPDLSLEVKEKDNITIVFGIIEKETILAISKNGVENIVLSPNISLLKLEIDAPSLVHHGEEFPMAIHLMDNETPIMKIKYSKVIVNTNKVLVITDNGILEKDIDLFLNKLRFNVTINGEKMNNTINTNVGEENIIEIDTDGFVDIDADIDYEVKDNRIIIIPNERGEYNLSIKAYREGYKDERIDLKIIVKRFVTLTINAQGPRNSLNVQFDSTLGRLTTPYKERLEVGSINMTFPQKYNDLDLQKVIINTVNGTDSMVRNNIMLHLDSDTTLNLIYGRNVVITVEDGEGSGSYPVGSSVVISANEKPIVPIILREVFDHWEGLPEGYDKNENNLTLIANESMTIRAVYRMDYIGLLLPIIVVAAIIVTKVVRR